MTVANPPPAGVTVLVADDSHSDRAFTTTVLRSLAGVTEITEAADGLSAVAIAKELHPSLALLDIAMPHMDGLEALPRIRSVSPQTQIIVASGYSSERMMAEAMELGATRFLSKDDLARELPATLTELFPELEVLAGDRPLEPEPAPATDRVDLVLDAIDEGVLVLGGSPCQVLTANFAATRILDRPHRDLVGADAADILDDEQVRDAIHRAANRSSIPVEIVRGERRRHVRVSVRPARLGVTDHEIVVTLTDLTPLQSAVQQLNEVLEALPSVSLIRFDEDMRFDLVTGPSLAGIGYAPDRVLGRTMQEVVPPERVEVLSQPYIAALAGERTVMPDYRSLDGRWWHLEFVPVRSDDGTRRGMITAMDITRFRGDAAED